MDDARTACRWCGATELQVVLDLGRQPPADHFPRADDPEPDTTFPLRMGVCRACTLVQLLEDPGVAEEPLGVEPLVLKEQSRTAVATLAEAGLIKRGTRFAEFDSPHGGSFRGWLSDVECVDLSDEPDQVELVIDVFGLMHEADQAAALRARAQRLAPGGTLVLQYHSLASIVGQRQWNALRHGHMAYYSTSALVMMLFELGLTATDAWEFELYGGTVLLTVRHNRPGGDPLFVDSSPAVHTLHFEDTWLKTSNQEGLRALEEAATIDAAELSAWLTEQRDAGLRVVGYGAASRAVPLLVRAGIDATLLPAVADKSPAKRGRCLPGSRIPIIAAEDLRQRDDDVVLLFVPDLLVEVRRAFPEIEERGARWAVSEPRPQFVAPKHRAH